jgi:hypothetical protein
MHRVGEHSPVLQHSGHVVRNNAFDCGFSSRRAALLPLLHKVVVSALEHLTGRQGPIKRILVSRKVRPQHGDSLIAHVSATVLSSLCFPRSAVQIQLARPEMVAPYSASRHNRVDDLVHTLPLACALVALVGKHFVLFLDCWIQEVKVLLEDVPPRCAHHVYSLVVRNRFCKKKKTSS